eukprot:gene2109-2428_t
MSTAILPMAEHFQWDKAFQGVILSAFFAGYAATQILGGSLADRYGGKSVLTTGVALWSLFTVITPAAAAAGTAPLLAARVLLGIGEGVAFPAIHSIIARNVPVAKRSTAVGIITAASYAGTALAFGISPLLISRFGWQSYAQSYGMYGLLTWLPTFFNDYYKVEVGDLGGYTLLPYMLQLLGVNGWSVRSVRITLQLAGMLGPAACLLASVSPLVNGSPEAAAALITLGLGFSALTLGAVSVSHLDIAPRHAGMVFGAGNTAATLAGLVSVPLTGWLLDHTGSWSLVFGLIAAHFVAGSVVWAAWVGDRPLPEDGSDLGAADNNGSTLARP